MCEPSQPNTVGNTTRKVGQLVGASTDAGYRRRGIERGYMQTTAANRELASLQSPVSRYT